MEAALLHFQNIWMDDTRHINHPDFYYGEIRLYVSDECAGVHEMLFISVLIMMTTGFSTLRIKSALVACGVVYLLISLDYSFCIRLQSWLFRKSRHGL